MTGIVIPALLHNLWVSGKTIYNTDRSEAWQKRCLTDPPAMLSCFDFEWISPAEGVEVVSEWLNPQYQSGRKFLPFAESGAGDYYCLMPQIDGEIGVAKIWHDADESRLEHCSFSDFVCTQFLHAFANLHHLLESFTELEALTLVKADVKNVAQVMDPIRRKHLMGLCKLEPTHRQFFDRPKAPARRVFSLISQEQLADELLSFPVSNALPFTVLPRWECG